MESSSALLSSSSSKSPLQINHFFLLQPNGILNAKETLKLFMNRCVYREEEQANAVWD